MPSLQRYSSVVASSSHSACVWTDVVEYLAGTLTSWSDVIEYCGLQTLCRTLELPGKLWFYFGVFLLLRYSRSAVPYSVIFCTICRGRPARDFIHPPPLGRASTPLYPSARVINVLEFLPKVTRNCTVFVTIHASGKV